MEPSLGQNVARIKSGEMTEGCIAVASGEYLLSLGKRLESLGARPRQPSCLSDPVELGKGKLPRSGELGNPELDGVQAAITLLWPVLQQEPLRRLQELRRAISRSSDNRLDPNL